MQTKETKWLYGQLPLLVKEGHISEANAEAIRGYYKALPEDGSNHSLSFLITAVLGALLIAAGIVTIFAYNWDDLSREWRAVFSILPLVAAQVFYGYAFLRKRDSAAWMESTSGFLMVMLVSSMALISQTYHLGGTMKDLLLYWCVLSIPLLYLKRVSTPFVLFICGITWRATLSESYRQLNVQDVVSYALLLLAAFPYLYFILRSSVTSAAKTIAGWCTVLSIGIAYPFLFSGDNFFTILYVYGLLSSVFYLAGKRYYAHEEHFWLRPFQTMAIIGTFSLGMIFSYDWTKFHNYTGIHYSIALNVFSLICLATMLFFFISAYRKKIFINPFPAATVLITWLCISLSDSGHTSISSLVANSFILLYGIFYLRQGIVFRKMSLVNAGMFFISLLVLVRFFDSNLGFLLKGIAFIIVGSGFLAANIFLNRKLKKSEAQHS